MTTPPPDDEELHQPRRRISTGVLATVIGVAVAGVVLVSVVGGDDPTPTPSPSSTARTPAPVADVTPPAALLRAVEAAYPRAELIDFGVAVPVRANSDRNYQFLAGARRITVVVGPVDARPEVQTTSRRDVLVVANRSGRRIVVSVRNFRGTVRPADLVAVQRLVRDTRLLATS